MMHISKEVSVLTQGLSESEVESIKEIIEKVKIKSEVVARLGL